MVFSSQKCKMKKNQGNGIIECDIYSDSIKKFCFDDIYNSLKNNKKMNLLFFSGYGSFSDKSLNCNIIEFIKSEKANNLKNNNLLTIHTFIVDDKSKLCNNETMATINSKGLFKLSNSWSTPRLVLLFEDSLINSYNYDFNVNDLMKDINTFHLKQ